MRLTRWQRLGLMIAAVAMLSAGGVGAVFDWFGVALTVFMVAGGFILAGALAGVMPTGGSIKAGSFEWPDVDKNPRIE